MQPFSTLADLLEHRAVDQPQDRAYVFVSGRGVAESELSFAELHRKARRAAAQIAERSRPGDRVLLVFPAGLDFITAFFGCLLAGVIAVPMMVPRRLSARDSSARIIADCSPRFALTSRALTEGSRVDLVSRFRASGMELLMLDVDAAAPVPFATRAGCRGDVAFLQYTSGSTSDPKGVVVSHGNLLENLEMIRIALGNTRQSAYVSWVPLYHDMGLILNALQSLYVGAPCALLAPATFMQRPLSWLRAIHEFRAEVAGAPNFAFDLCVDRFREDLMQGVDLSGWRVAFNGAEPVRADTIERFSRTFAPFGFDPRAFYPCYGMAEATLLISGGRRGSGPLVHTVSRVEPEADSADTTASDGEQRVVGCGHALIGERIAIVEPRTRQRLAARRIGEIWVHGSNVAQGYWGKPDETEAEFRAAIALEPETSWLRTGDLGFLDEAGELYVTGRIKDLIIIRGINHYPQDIEHTVQNSHPMLRKHCGAAFMIAGDEGERLIVVQEVERAHRHDLEVDEIIGNIRQAIAEEHELSVTEIVLIRTGTLPKTTSGKIQRSLARRLWLKGALEVAGERSNYCARP